MRCHRCGSKELIATEITEALMDFKISDGQIHRLRHTDEFSDVVGLRLRCCGCGHGWIPRKIKSIYQLSELNKL